MNLFPSGVVEKCVDEKSDHTLGCARTCSKAINTDSLSTGAKPEDHITGVGFIGTSGSTVQMNSVACGDWWISSGSGDPDK